MLSSHDILEQTGIKNAKTLTRWHQQGLIPPPEVRLHPSGRGKMGYWPAWVVERCIRIRQLVKEGHSLEEVPALLGSDWDAEERKAKRRRYRFKEAAETLDFLNCRRNFASAVAEKCDALLRNMAHLSPRASAPLDAFLLDEKTGKKILSLLRDGYNPVLVHAGDGWELVPDFIVHLLLGRGNKGSNACLVVPVFEEAVTAFKAMADDLPAAPATKAAPRAVKTRGGKSVEYVVRPVRRRDFKLVKK